MTALIRSLHWHGACFARRRSNIAVGNERRLCDACGAGTVLIDQVGYERAMPVNGNHTVELPVCIQQMQNDVALSIVDARWAGVVH